MIYVEDGKQVWGRKFGITFVSHKDVISDDNERRHIMSMPIPIRLPHTKLYKKI